MDVVLIRRIYGLLVRIRESLGPFLVQAEIHASALATVYKATVPYPMNTHLPYPRMSPNARNLHNVVCPFNSSTKVVPYIKIHACPITFDNGVVESTEPRPWSGGMVMMTHSS
jgi:hypothetical protein